MSYPEPTNPYAGRFLGVLGGMGPQASAAFMMRLTALTPAVNEQDHIPTILWSDPRVPGRPAAYEDNGPSPVPWMNNGIRQLCAAGAQAITIPCNTAHLWYDDLAKATPLPILHIVHAVIDDIRRQGITSGRVGVLATATTIRLELYQHALLAAGYEPVVLADTALREYCLPAIELVKKNAFDAAQAPAARSIRALQQQGVVAVVLGCTELPLALPHALRDEFGLCITDSLDALALAAIHWYEEKAPGSQLRPPGENASD